MKVNYHVDEIFSYGHANSSEGAFLVKGINADFDSDSLKLLYNHWLDISVIHNYLTVQPAEQFKYKHIFENMALGVHPPLFYILLHTICSFTPEIISKWQGAVLNIPLWICLLIMIYKLAKRFLKDKYLALLSVAFYAYSQTGLNTVLYIRGYLMQTLWAVCLLYEMIYVLQEKETTKRQWFLIFLYSLLGMLTQYNSIIYSAIIGIIIGCGLLLQKRYKHLILLALMLLLSLIGLFVIFPDAANVLLHSSRSQEIINVTLSDKLRYFALSSGDAKNLSSVYMTGLWSFRENYGYILFELVLLTLVYKYLYAKKDKSIDLLMILYVIMCLYTEFFMPSMYIYDMRYIMLVIPIIAIVTIWYLNFILAAFCLRNKYIILILSFVVFINSCFVDFGNRSPYAFNKKSFEKIDLAGNVMLVWDESIFMYEAINMLEKSSGVYMTPYDTPIENLLKELDKSDYFVVSNMNAKFGMYMKPSGPKEIPPEIKDRVNFIKTIKTGERFYDIYEVLKIGS